MVKKLLPQVLLAITLTIVSCSKDPVEEVLHERNTVVDPIRPSAETEPADPIESISEADKPGNWIDQMQESNGLLRSSEYHDFVSLYDNALSAIWFTSKGELSKTKKILDFFDGKVQSELLSGSGGFYQFRNSNGENGSRTWMGDNAWLLIAINQYHEVSGNQKYQHMADALENWLRSLQDEDGGLWGGINEDGSQIPKVTEGMITAFNAVKGYDNFHKNILTFIKLNRWNADGEHLLAWPENPKYENALDMHSLGFMIFEDFPQATLDTSEMFLNTQELTLSGEMVTGYCFDTDKDVVWLEGTAQMAIAFQVGGHVSNSNQLLTDLEKTFISSTTLTEAKGIPYTTNFGTTYGSNLLWDHADLTPALSSTIWYLFAKTGFSPLEIGRSKNVPVEDKFW